MCEHNWKEHVPSHYEDLACTPESTDSTVDETIDEDSSDNDNEEVDESGADFDCTQAAD
jgi:hypothetical protein